MRGIVAACTLMWFAACTFPDVDYADGGVTSSTSGGGDAGDVCPVPSSCALTAMNCAQQADKKDMSCRKSCQSNTTCMAQCDAALQSMLAGCMTACDTCGAPACGDTTTNCKALINP
ncbi:MAG: hypothetical protein QM820_26145 [Minicystis sp.]